ncbi:HNWD1 protein [Mycoavidus cysteinexigens]|uniref:HNWD1 protein n=1 Tax=Mycoavidus cysteinexigens TaxID=1553431 RepID=A0A2Z6ET23_9BURK|nr:NACHT domain-containing protein [Mycoavidus cysteinexigens]BBE08545.1 HNWD1 protein [Mycoavidus cysteinexigens]GAM52749.1 hypothetical protein EBME_1212 [bacterium endosymbiont of Mortierella elongata FMR23-6]GLR01012.1 hypothetical protein GCM10007934_08240 [Mycoavidus cysteinexigens]
MFPISEARSVTQNSYGLINISVYGAHNESTVNFDARALDPKVVEALMQSFEKSQENQRKALQPILEPLAKLGVDADRFKQTYKSHLERSGEVDVLSMYVPVQGIKKGQQGEETVELEAELERFFASEATVFLLQGVAGTGKSTFNRHLALKKLEDYQRLSQTQNDPPLVFFIELRSIENPNKQVIEQFLQGQGFASEQIELLRTHLHQRCIFIFDGYDEIKERNRNFYDLNELWQWEKAKFVITSRPEYLDTNYQAYFRPKKAAPDALWEARMAPFSAQQRSNYIENYVNKSNPPWTVEQYEQAFNELTTLSKELERPVVLRMLLQILPELGEMNPNQKALTLGAIYEHYFQKWWGNWQTRLGAIALTPNEEEAKQELSECEGGFIQQGFTYIESCAVELTKAGLTSAQDHPNFKKRNREVHEVFFTGGARTRLLRFNAPFQMKQKQHYEFSHKSMQEYLVARAICAPDFEAIEPHPEDVLNQLSLVKEPVILDFLVERVKGKPQFKAYLHAWIEASKDSNAVNLGAANAMTVLVRAWVQFWKMNLNGIRIPGADLSHGVFDSAQLQRADLKGVRAYSAWFRGADMSDANLAGIEFGEKPALEMDSAVWACCYSLDNCWLAVGTRGGDIYLYDTQALEPSYTLKRPLTGSRRWINGIAFSPNSQWMVSGSGDGLVKLWSVSTGQLERKFNGHSDEVLSVEFSPDGQLLASGSVDKSVKLWSINTGTLQYTFEGHNAMVQSIVFSPDGQRLVSGSKDQTIKLWAVRMPKLECTLEFGEIVLGVSLSSDGKWLASGGVDSTVKLWTLSSTGAQLHQTLKHDGIVKCVLISSESKWLVTGAFDNKVRLWKLVSTGALLHQTFEWHSDKVMCISMSSDRRWIVSGSDDKTVKFWRVTGTEWRGHSPRDGHSDLVSSMSISSDSKWLATGSWDKTVKLWALSSTGAQLHQTFNDHGDSVRSVLISPDGKWLASGSEDKTVKLWELISTGTRLHQTLDAHSDGVSSISISPDNKWLATGGWDGIIKLWTLSSAGAQLHQTLNEHRDLVRSMSFSPDGRWLASGSKDKTAKLWMLSKTGLRLYQTLVGHSGPVWSLSISSDSKWLATGSWDGTVKLWGLDKIGAQLCQTFGGRHREALEDGVARRNGVLSVSISPDNKWLAYGGWNKKVELQSLDTAEYQVITRGFVGSIFSIIWQKTDGGLTRILIGGESVLRIFQLERKVNYWAASLVWTSHQNQLSVTDLLLRGVQGLSSENIHLLIQKGATQVSEPTSAPKA